MLKPNILQGTFRKRHRLSTRFYTTTSPTTRKRIVITGGSGKAGQYIIPYLLNQGHEILNLDLNPPPNPLGDIHTIKTDLTDSGQVFNALSSHFKLTQPFRSPILQPPDAIIHLAGYARNMLVPDNETFRGNAIGTYNIIEAACKLGIRKLVLASSVCVYGVTYAEGDIDFPSFPIDEEIDANPMDTYSLSKVTGERVARGFAARFGIDAYILRIGALIAPEDYHTDTFRGYIERPEEWKVHGWSYVDARDLGQMCDLCVRRDGLGFQVFNATNDEITNWEGTEGFLRRVAPNTPFRRRMGEREAPMSNWKIREMLGFREEHNWRRYCKEG
ncbi:hypothetical protein BKA61DRAFT_616351 [Leptodontidium sp. MPI-SDFR-AT-0119]|nr:hypothetical protein BKA61DRAFT_616351 [Leptodontidium sp. MPI-SDFR-AT-0119]